MRGKNMAKKKTARKCKVCGGALEETNLWLCESCQAAGMGERIKRPEIDTMELLTVARRREGMGLPPLEGMKMEEINALARCWSPPYSTYGRFRGYVWHTGRLPPEEARRK